MIWILSIIKNNATDYEEEIISISDFMHCHL